MAALTFVTEREVLEIKLEGRGQPKDGRQVTQFAVSTKKDGSLLGEWIIRATDEVVEVKNQFSQDVGRSLVALVRPKLQASQYSGEMVVCTSNADQLLAPGRSVSEEEQEFEVAKILWRFFYEKDSALETDVVARSTGYGRDEVGKILTHIARLGILRTEVTGKTINLTRDGMPKLEELIRQGTRRRFPPVGYFHEVPLPPEFEAPYVFVLMPFSEDQLPQHRFFEIIKPVVEATTGAKCWRADDKQNQLPITDQIFTQIVRAEVLLAEITSLNPNVMIEIGVALANNKQVYIFYDTKRLASLPFYIGKIPCKGYADDNELRKKLEEVRIPNR
jgi:hypothetical protein